MAGGSARPSRGPACGRGRTVRGRGARRAGTGGAGPEGGTPRGGDRRPARGRCHGERRGPTRGPGADRPGESCARDAGRAMAVRHGRHARPDRRACSADNRGAAGNAEVPHRDRDWGRRTGDECGHHGACDGERRAVARAGRCRPAARQPARHGLDRAARGARVRPVPGRAGEPRGPGGGVDLRGGRCPARGVPDARRRHRRRDRVRARPARVGSHAGVSGARARRVGRGPARRRGVCLSAVRRTRAPRRQRAAAGAGGALCAGGAGRRDAHPLMPLDFGIDRLDALPATRALAEGLPASGARQGIAGLPGSSPAVLLAALARRLAQRVFVLMTPTPTDAERWLADLRALTGSAAALYPQREALGAEEPHFEIAGERVETLELLLSGHVRALVTTARAAAERTGVPGTLQSMRLVLAKGEQGAGSGTLRETVQRLEAMGYVRVPTVTEVAQFSVRGGILDVYGFGMAAAARLEWWGDDIESLRTFDLDSQRSGEAIERMTILPVRTERAGTGEGEVGAQRAAPLQRQSLPDIPPSEAVVVLEQESALGQEVERAWADAAHHLEGARRLGEEQVAREALFVDPAAWRAQLARFPRIALDPAQAPVRFPIAPPEPIDRDIKRLRQIVATEPPTVILCDNEGQLERLEELLAGDRATLAVGALDGGFVLPGLRVLTNHEIFRRARRLRRPRRYREATATAATRPLTTGDYVVHLEHGIGIYRGIQTIPVGAEGGTLEVAVVEYEGGSRLNVPLYRLDQLEPYRSAADGDAPPPRLHRLGTTTRQRQRDKTRAAIRQMAVELLDLYARRQLAAGFAFPPDTAWQRELESAFLYEDTPDQRRASEEVKRDMERARPMDRLLVGDVGYGKTEVALRAAFKAVQAGKQVAVLVPTTILAEQHGRTFRERLADYPVRIEVLSRFRSVKDTAQVTRRLETGEVDVVIGTHRLLSRDVGFHDLGLLVVDEEHRFGVRHKERLKELKLA